MADILDPSLLGPDPPGAGDDLAPAGDDGQHVAGVRAFGCARLAGVGVVAAGAVWIGRGVPSPIDALPGACRRQLALRGIHPIDPGGVAVERIQPAVGAHPEGPKRANLADLRLESRVVLHRSLDATESLRRRGFSRRLRRLVRVRRWGRCGDRLTHGKDFVPAALRTYVAHAFQGRH
jgi:hypothetical protein